MRLEERPFVPIHPQPPKPLDDSVHEFRLVALRVGVLDAQDHGSAGMMARKQPIEESSAGSPHVKVSRRRGGKSHTYVLTCHFNHLPAMGWAPREASSVAKPAGRSPIPGGEHKWLLPLSQLGRRYACAEKAFII